MAVITLPDNNFRSAQWTLVQPTQVNRSEFTGARQVMQLPGASYWRASVEHVPVRGEPGIRAWRSFFAKLQGTVNTFRLPATEGAQHAGSRPFIANNAFITPVNVSGMDVAVGRARQGVAADGNFKAARSTGTLGNGAELSFFVRQVGAGGAVLVALNRFAATIAGAAPPQVGFRVDGTTGILASYVNGTVTNLQFHNPADRLSIVISGGTALLYVNGLLSTSAALDPAYTYYSEFASITFGDEVDDIAWGIPSNPGSLLRVCGLPSGTLLSPGALMTVPLRTGGEQLVVLTDGLAGDADGRIEVSVGSLLRGIPLPGTRLETANPHALVAMDTSEAGWSVDPGAVYGFGFSATEAF